MKTQAREIALILLSTSLGYLMLAQYPTNYRLTHFVTGLLLVVLGIIIYTFTTKQLEQQILSGLKLRKYLDVLLKLLVVVSSRIRSIFKLILSNSVHQIIQVLASFKTSTVSSAINSLNKLVTTFKSFRFSWTKTGATDQKDKKVKNRQVGFYMPKNSLNWVLVLSVWVLILGFYYLSFQRFLNAHNGVSMFYVWQGVK